MNGTVTETGTAATPGRVGSAVRQVGAGLGEALLAALVAVVVAGVGLFAFSLVQWPAFNSSNVTRALTTVGQVGAAVLLVAAIWLLRERKWPWMAKLLSWAGISTFVTVTLGMPLAATKLYLFGVSVDQEFRTEYLTRLTDSAALRDMTYVDLPPFYPAGWFWVGGRVANVLGMDGWEAFKPYAIGSLAVAAVLSLVLWSKLIRADWAVAVTAATTAVTVTWAAPEAYSAVIVLLFAPALVLAWGALHRPAAPGAERTAGGWGAVVGTGLFLGMAATFYTLHFLVAAFAVALMGLLAAWSAVRAQRVANSRRGAKDLGGAANTGSATNTGSAKDTGSAKNPAGAGRPAWRAAVPPLLRLLAIAVLAGLIAAIVWLPYLLKTLSTKIPSSGTALHYLPQGGAELPLPMVEFTLLGGLCLIGTIWLVLRAGSSRRAQALGIGVLAIYLWTLLSMVATAAGTTLLSFRLDAPLKVLLAAAGAFGFVEGARALYQALNEPAALKPVAAALAVLGALAFAQDIPHVLTPEINTAYTDTDGDGVRADQRPPAAVAHYREVDAALLAQTGRPRDQTVVLTADTSFLAFYPYFGFQALTSHYANPLADFPARAALIADWSKLKSAPELLNALAQSPWRAPDAFLFRRSGDNYTLRLARDVYPNDPNVERYPVAFPKMLFADPAFTTTEIGPFTLVTVKRA
ncbi:galactan 5-O-arabinofuranosyltransferase [Nocardia goodfellowii]|uniref:Galactan 5-O-arabinofuranosyltransferase n=1 Tax=Nocardia goodfellowii TaxID=882446 RepID=A0ABS4QAC7_9NOCA|nr:galactan 5-O-arabinofuranosyltransferase [Nocardia goodfellowii]MBP2188075.1 galactan 5-O-arabinofuranosyltransferase [Nocardia goodfellowii]